LKNKTIYHLFIYHLQLKKLYLLIGFLCFIAQGLLSQKLGLVLSGGGAPGIAHIGVIKALEENNIPVDYITGTSIGAIIGGMYAMGMTPDEMIAVIHSDDFKQWINGESEWKNLYYYHQPDPKPGIVDFRFTINKWNSSDLKFRFLPSNLVSPGQMNYAFVPLFSQANALCGGNFDKLFVPFRCVASDIYNKEAVVFRQAELGDAIRASMTFPFMFMPIKINNRLLFDGGIYNNFPVDVMCEDFHPNFTIGSVVAYNPPKADKNDPMMLLQNMIIHHTDYSLPAGDGLLFNFNLKAFNTFDFTKVDELVQIGYDSVMAHLDEIKARIPRQVPKEELAELRKNFRSRFPTLNFRRIEIEGIDSIQKLYLKYVLPPENKILGQADFKKIYFKLISDDRISEIIPHAKFDPSVGYFDLNLNIETQDQMKLMLGGFISSSTTNQAYLGLSYQNLSKYAQSACIDAQFGKTYNGFSLGTRIEIPSRKSNYLKLIFVLHQFDYYKSNRLFLTENRMQDFTQNEVYTKLSTGFPIGMNGLLESGIGYGLLSDHYKQNNSLINSNQGYDVSSYALGSVFTRFESNTLNNLMYPTRGFHYTTSLQLTGGNENFRSANDSTQNLTGQKNIWLQYLAKAEHYFPLSPRFTMGIYGELTVSNRKLLQNYIATIIQARSFEPTAYSRSVFNEAFSANQFVVVGIKPVYKLNDLWHVRTEAYCFVPYKSILRSTDNSAAYSKPFSASQFMAETSLVFNYKMASAALFTNYNSSHWNFGVNIGILLFEPKFTE